MADYYVTTWTTADGAPSVVRTISQTADGWLWLAATDGLYRFDGKTFESVSNSPDFPREAKGGVSVTFAGADGNLWIGVQGGRTARLHDGRWELFGAETDMGNVSIIARDTGGTMWAACSSGLFWLDGKTWRNVGVALGIRQAEPLDNLYADVDGSLWIATSSRVYHFGAGASVVESTGIELADGGDFVPSPEGDLYIISSDGQIKQIPSAGRHPLRHHGSNDEPKNGHLSEFNGDGSLWSIQCSNRICSVPKGTQFPEDSSVAALKTEEGTPDVRGGMTDLFSFAAITDEPPPEVLAAGHDRCIVPIKPQYVDAWLRPLPGDLTALYAILDDRARPYYEHRLAA
ncbi:ligand-binding sensor domain-containing protein [Dyella sp. Tek66A03]|uniref:ligand-binding sensor domain-containing protein n=1 Tax=Dyella sp. Tek66A03 TaxID=3458298 RepID=UPI00403EEBED